MCRARVVSAERTFRVADAGERIAEDDQRRDQGYVVAIAARLDGFDGRFDDVDGLDVFGDLDAPGGIPHGLLDVVFDMVDLGGAD